MAATLSGLCDLRAHLHEQRARESEEESNRWRQSVGMQLASGGAHSFLSNFATIISSLSAPTRMLQRRKRDQTEHSGSLPEHLFLGDS